MQAVSLTPSLRALGISQHAKSPEIFDSSSKPDNGPVASPTMCDCRSTGQSPSPNQTGKSQILSFCFLFLCLHPFHTAFLMTGFYLALKLNIWNFYLLGFFSLSWKIMFLLPVSIFLLCLVSFSILDEFLPSSSLKQPEQLKLTSNLTSGICLFALLYSLQGKNCVIWNGYQFMLSIFAEDQRG